MRKIIGISMVKNEVDVIETFVRHNLTFLDELHIIDHYSNDNTRKILTLLQQEGLPVYLYQVDEFSYQQETIMTTLLHHCLNQDPDIAYCLPIDADEFIDCPDKATFAHLIHSIPPDRVGLLFFNHYIPSSFEFNPNFLTEFSEIRQEEMLISRVIIPRAQGLRGKFSTGYHFFFENTEEGISFPYFAFLPQKYTHFQQAIAAKCEVIFQEAECVLAHYPIRSHPQFLVKMLTGSVAMGIRNKQGGSDYNWMNRAGYYFLRDQYTLNDLRKEAYEYHRTPNTQNDFSKVNIHIVENRALLQEPYLLKYMNEIELDPLKSLYQSGMDMVNYYTEKEGKQ